MGRRVDRFDRCRDDDDSRCVSVRKFGEYRVTSDAEVDLPEGPREGALPCGCRRRASDEKPEHLLRKLSQPRRPQVRRNGVDRVIDVEDHVRIGASQTLELRLARHNPLEDQRCIGAAPLEQRFNPLACRERPRRDNVDRPTLGAHERPKAVTCARPVPASWRGGDESLDHCAGILLSEKKRMRFEGRPCFPTSRVEA
jgi:hypothetical protein